MAQKLPSPRPVPAIGADLPELPPAQPAGVSEALFPGFQPQNIQTSGATIHTLSKGQGQPLLLIHGHPETHVTWHKVAPALVDAGYRVIVPDLRGYGDSSKPGYSPESSNYSFRAVCEDYRAAAGIGLDMDRADDKAGHKIKAPLLALWGAKGTVGKLWNVLDTWRPKAEGPITGEALPCGHLIPEEQPELVISHFRQFFVA